MPNVVFDEQSARRIADTVRTVEKLGGDKNQPPIDYGGAPSEFRTVIRGQFTGEWAKDTDKDVDFTADNGDAKTKTATNYFADVGESGVTSACCIIQAGGEWILIAAECG